jgi:hypothetical protein
MNLAIGWSVRQDEIMAAHPDWSDDDLAIAVSAAGAPRTTKAIEARRKVLGMKRSDPANRGYWTPESARQARERQNGWPAMSASPEDRDASFVRRLLLAQLEIVRRGAW